MADRLAGQVALITGASSGIGRASALALAGEGASLVVTARRQDRLEELVALATAGGGRAVSVVGDAREEETARSAVSAAIESFGKLSILINNVGVGIYGPLVDTTLSDYVEMMDTNMRSTFLFSRHAVPHMISEGQGMILNISSMAGKYGFAGEAAYCASKFAQVGFAQALDKELHPFGIKVGVICPGGVKTEFAIGTGRTVDAVAGSGMLEPEYVAEAVLLACTQATGSRIIEIQMRPMSEPLA
jgi:NADP-dependent 3-hydroxy acid dehydrogenase YdfG